MSVDFSNTPMGGNGSRLMTASDFDNAHNKALLGTVFEILRYGTTKLVPFGEIRDELGFVPEKRLGRQQVEIDKIVGSEGRHGQFTRGFLPKSRALKRRWMDIDRAHLEMATLPPIEVYEVGGVYFVRDGNHRVSVAKTKGLSHIEAEVTSLPIGGRLRPGMNLDQMRSAVQQIQHDAFYEKTGLGEIAPDEDFRLTLFLGYEKLYRNIREFGIQMGDDRNVPRVEERSAFREVVRHWYTESYSRVAAMIREMKIGEAFPDRTTADTFLLFCSFVSASDDSEKARRVFVDSALQMLRSRGDGRSGLKGILTRICTYFFRAKKRGG
jgi:hypothetical protein